MKKTILLVLLTSLLLESYGQKFSLEKYLKKGKKQATIAWIMLGGGLVISATGLGIGLANIDIVVDGYESPDENKVTIESVLFFGGAAMIISSIPFFVSSFINKRKGRNTYAFIKAEKSEFFRGNSIVNLKIPSAGIAFKF